MCGRYTLTNKKEVKKKFEIDIEQNFNICPSSKVLVYTNKPEWMEWNYSPSWAKKPMNLINARYETIDEKPSFKDMNRCVFIMDGWYEWKRENKEKYKYLSFLPGSRQNEVLKLIKYFSYIEKYISKNNLNYKIFIPTLPHLASLIKENTKYCLPP